MDACRGSTETADPVGMWKNSQGVAQALLSSLSCFLKHTGINNMGELRGSYSWKENGV